MVETAVTPLLPSDPSRVGPFRLLGRLGSGGMGTVYAGQGRKRETVAVKTVHPELAADREFRARFAREVALVRKVDSPYAPAFVAADPRARLPWLVTEYVAGPTLEARVRGQGPLAEGPLRDLATGTLAALRDLHAHGVVHRDLKPSNVVLGQNGPKVLDFGIARALDGTVLTRTGGLAGSSGWIAPERYRDGTCGPGADVFTWGALMAFAATGRPPFGSGTPQAVTRRVISADPDLTGVPGWLLPDVRDALAKDPTRRPRAEDLLARAAVHGGAPVAAAPPRPRDVRSRGGSRALLWGAAGAAALLVAAGGVAGATVLGLWGDGIPGGGTDDPSRPGGAGTAEAETVENGGPEGEGAGEAGSGDGGSESGNSGGESEPPLGARTEARNIGHEVQVKVALDPERTADEDGDFLHTDEGEYGAFQVNPGPVDTWLHLTEPRLEGEGFVVDVGLANPSRMDLTRGFLTVHTPEGVLHPTSPDEDLEAGKNTVRFEGQAPQRGLLVMGDPEYEQDVRGLPPVGLCYFTGAGPSFSAEYDDCL